MSKKTSMKSLKIIGSIIETPQKELITATIETKVSTAPQQIASNSKRIELLQIARRASSSKIDESQKCKKRSITSSVSADANLASNNRIKQLEVRNFKLNN